MEKKHHFHPKGSRRHRPYSQGWIAGSMVYTSGQVPVDPASGEIPRYHRPGEEAARMGRCSRGRRRGAAG